MKKGDKISYINSFFQEGTSTSIKFLPKTFLDCKTCLSESPLE